LVVLGSGGMASAGYSRGDEEKHAWPMPNFGESITDEHEIWKIIAHIRSLNSSSAAK
jgi:hypothetical protein